MGDKGKSDKQGREDRKKPKHSLKEKRKLKQEKKTGSPTAAQILELQGFSQSWTGDNQVRYLPGA